MPGSITLLLGPPGSGKSSLLEILEGRVKENKNSMMKGSVMYNDKDTSDICLTRLIAYITTFHFYLFGKLNEFARDCTQGCTQGLRQENFTPQMRKFFAQALVEGQNPFLEYVLETLNLKQIEHKLTGEGISDTDRQRLTTAELALGTYSVMLYDQPFSGSDLAATYDLVDTIRAISRIQQSLAIMSLTQLYIKPSHVESSGFLEGIAGEDGSQYIAPEATSYTLEELVECYRASDHYKDIMRIVHEDEVKHIYWVESEAELGFSLKTPSKYYCPVLPTEKPLYYTNSNGCMVVELVVSKISNKVGHPGGIESTGRVQVGDLVTAISTINDEMQYLSVGTKNMQHKQTSHAYSMLKRAQGRICLQVERYREEEDEYQAQWEQFQRPFVQTWWKSTRTLINRQIKITKRLHSLIKLRLLQAIVLGLLAGTLFYKLGGEYNQQKMNSIRALGYVSTMTIMLINLVQLPVYMLQRPIFNKHRNQRFFRTSSYIVANGIVNLPQTLLEALSYTLSVHFFAGLSLAGHGGPLFEYLVLFFLVAYFGSSVFFLLSTISSIPEVGNALADSSLNDNVVSLTEALTQAVSISEVTWSTCFNLPTLQWLCDLPIQYTNILEMAYLYAERPWLPFAILLGWIVLANLLTLLGLKKIDFTGMSPGLPHLKNSPLLWTTNFKERLQQDDNSGGVEKWIEDFRVDLERKGLGIPVKPVTLLFEELSFSRYDGGTKKNTSVFNYVTGYARPRTMLALLGGSKRSKTTLLKCLAGRIPLTGSIRGNLQANGIKISATFSRLTGYVEKLDAHQHYLSLRESL
ncbi:hypothetical protein FEM48_Zijuj02G0125400 [Ziziphus jujuba var. spinosa]|uniref:ABC transporter domain-containing protein n=1 Tax=Ziziphus jujuba var. spinosa TaxID=714518 RepID=A0A978VVR6_ZIZJJ|nr:hypothetical protein FEM48_Zijuj02G0125400 [Ziziphus jujuba var. spinosa]